MMSNMMNHTVHNPLGAVPRRDAPQGVEGKDKIMGDYETLIQTTLVLPKNEPIYSALVTKITLEDNVAGLFVRVTQEPDEGTQSIAIEPEEWPILRAVIDTAVQTCQERNQVQS